MTTIAYKDGVMSADSQATFGDTKIVGYNKVRLGAMSLIGYAGAPRYAEAVFDWWKGIEDTAEHPKNWYFHRPEHFPSIPEGDMLAMVAMRNGSIWRLYPDLHTVRVLGSYAAIGTGEAFALGAMANGASSESAVEIAAQFDLCSALPVYCVKL